MDYRDLLKRYLGLILAQEGTLYQHMDFGFFTPEEWAELNALSEED